MPRDANATRARLLREAERRFASVGVYSATLREITEAAGQRNTSALSYHFGSREGVLGAIVEYHERPIDAERGAMLVDPIDDMSTRDLVGALLVPYARPLATPEGRDYLRIVAQLTDLFPVWRSGELTPPNLRRVLTVLESRAGGHAPAAQRERVVSAVMLISSAMAQRAKLADGAGSAGSAELAQDDFLANLADLIVGGLEAPAGGRLSGER